MIVGEFVSEMDVEVCDIDENVFCEGKVIVKYYGEMCVFVEFIYV